MSLLLIGTTFVVLSLALVIFFALIADKEEKLTDITITKQELQDVSMEIPNETPYPIQTIETPPSDIQPSVVVVAKKAKPTKRKTPPKKK
jgi:hypothetical protein